MFQIARLKIIFTDSTEVLFSKLRSAGLNYFVFSLTLTVPGYLISIAYYFFFIMTTKKVTDYVNPQWFINFISHPDATSCNKANVNLLEKSLRIIRRRGVLPVQINVHVKYIQSSNSILLNIICTTQLFLQGIASLFNVIQAQ